MLSINQIKLIHSLHQAKFRKTNRLFLAEGPKLVFELIQSDYRVHSIYALEDWIRVNPEIKEVIAVSQKELHRISTLKSPNEVLAVVEIPQYKTPGFDRAGQLTLVLDEIRDPGNMGTILRTADWFGISSVICSQHCVELYNPKVVQATMGSLFRLHVDSCNLLDFFKTKTDKLPVYGALLNGKNLYDEELSQNGYLIIGSESHGISKSLFSSITHPITIPAYSGKPGKRAESLNASIAAAILCAEFRRRSK